MTSAAETPLRSAKFVDSLLLVCFFLWGIGLSLPRNQIIGIGRLHFADALFALPAVLVLASPAISREFRAFVRKHAIVMWLGLAVIACMTLGTATALARGHASVTSGLVVYRQAYYILVLLPVVAYRSQGGGARRLMIAFIWGILTSLCVNLIDMQASGNLAAVARRQLKSLPGQNPAGQMLSLVLPFILWGALAARRRRIRLVMLFVYLLMIVSILLTLSKSAWIAAALGSILVLILPAPRNAPGRRPTSVLLWGGVITLCVILAGAQLSWLTMNEVSASAASGSNEQRIRSALAGITIALEHPFGVGDYYAEFAPDAYVTPVREIADPHNAYAHAATWLGFVGFPLFLILFFYPGLLALARYRRLSADRVPILSMLAVFYLVGANTSGEAVTQPFAWAILGLVIGWASSGSQRTDPAVGTPGPRPTTG
jgi:hypothetical protein